MQTCCLQDVLHNQSIKKIAEAEVLGTHPKTRSSGIIDLFTTQDKKRGYERLQNVKYIDMIKLNKLASDERQLHKKEHLLKPVR